MLASDGQYKGQQRHGQLHGQGADERPPDRPTEDGLRPQPQDRRAPCFRSGDERDVIGAVARLVKELPAAPGHRVVTE